MPSTVKYATAIQVFESFNQHNHDDAPQMNRILDAVSRSIDGYMNRVNYGFVALTTAAPHVYAGDGTGHLYTEDFIGIPTVKMKTTLSSTTYDFTFSVSEILGFRGDYQKPNYNGTPYHGIIITYGARRTRFTNGQVPIVHAHNGQFGRVDEVNPREQTELPTVEITAKWGHATTCPPQIVEATIMQAERWYKRERAGMGDAVYNDTLGQFAFFKELDPEVKMMLDKTRLRRITRIR